MKVNYSGSYGISKVIDLPELLNGTEYANTMNEISIMRGGNAFFSQSDISAIPNEVQLISEIV